jgi:hypothetical protein
MKQPSAFDHRPDPELGDRLREALTPGGEPEFVRRVLARLPARMQETGWDILGAWARPGLVAAAVLLFLAGGWLGRVMMPPPEPVDTAVLTLPPDAGTVLAAQGLPQLDVDLVLLGEP